MKNSFNKYKYIMCSGYSYLMSNSLRVVSSSSCIFSFVSSRVLERCERRAFLSASRRQGQRMVSLMVSFVSKSLLSSNETPFSCSSTSMVSAETVKYYSLIKNMIIREFIRYSKLGKVIYLSVNDNGLGDSSFLLSYNVLV